MYIYTSLVHFIIIIIQDDVCGLGKAHNYTLHSVSQTFHQRCLGNSSNIRLTDGGPFSSFKKDRLTLTLYASLLQAIDGVMS